MSSKSKILAELIKIFSAPVINPNINILPYTGQNDKDCQEHHKIWR